MNITTSAHDGVAIIRIEARFTAASTAQFRTAVADAIAAGAPRIAVDLAAATFVDSSGLGALVGGLKSARVAGGDLRLAAVPDQVRSVLRLTNLDRVLGSYDSAETAFNG